MSNLAFLLESLAHDRPEAHALLAPGRPAASYRALWHQVRLCATRLRALGVTPDARVAVVLPNGPEMASTFLAVAACASCAPLNPAYQAAEFRFYLEDLRARFVIVRSSESGPIREVADALGLVVIELDVDPAAPAGTFGLAGPGATPDGAPAEPAFAPADAVALILHTSGTTARPKIVPLTQANLLASARSVARTLALVPGDRCLNVMPLFHIHGLVGALLSSLSAGASVHCAPGFEAGAFFEAIAACSPSWYTAVPTIHQSVLAAGEQYRRKAPGHRFRFVRSSSAALSPRTAQGLEALFEAPVIEAYGMTEASHQMASNPLPPAPRKPGSVGLAAGAEIAIMDEAGRLLACGETGEIVIRGASVMRRYEATDEVNARAFVEGWFRTGDQGRLDAEGYLTITGRLKEIVNRGGEKIAPREIDEALLEHPDVLQATAFAVPHASLGEDLAAAVVLRAGAGADEAQLREFLFGRLAEFKVPSQIVCVDEIPKGPTGKVQRTVLHKALADRLQGGFEEPASPLESELAAIVQAVLGVPRVGRDDNFFALGGDSLRGTQAMARVNDRYALQFPVVELFRHPTVAALAARVERARQEAVQADAASEAALLAELESLSDDEVARMLAALEGADGDLERMR